MGRVDHLVSGQFRLGCQPNSITSLNCLVPLLEHHFGGVAKIRTRRRDDSDGDGAKWALLVAAASP